MSIYGGRGETRVGHSSCPAEEYLRDRIMGDELATKFLSGRWREIAARLGGSRLETAKHLRDLQLGDLREHLNKAAASGVAQGCASSS